MKSLTRRSFVRAAAASAGAVMLPSFGEGEETATSSKAARSTTARKPARTSLAEGTPRELVLDLLALKADFHMGVCHNCAQSSFLALEEVFGLDGGSIVKALTPLPGIAERGETCGAVIGSLMALGLVYGRDRLDDWSGWRASLVPARAFCDRFEQELGSTMCGDILEKLFGKRFDLADPTDLAEFQAADATTICSRVVRKAVRIAAEIILDKS